MPERNRIGGVFANAAFPFFRLFYLNFYLAVFNYKDKVWIIGNKRILGSFMMTLNALKEN